MTGTLRTKTLSSGKSYYYINLSYKDPRTNKWKAKTISTGLEVKNNKRKAEAMIRQILEQYAYLEDLPLGYDSISKNYPRLLGITFMGAYYGLRRSEILGLKWSAVDFEKKTLSIKHTVVRVKTVNAEDETKTVAGKRVLNLFGTAESCLRQIEKEQLRNKEFFQSDYQNYDGYVFTWEDGRTYNPDYISKLFKKAMKTFGRPEITLHNLRHSCASILINKGWDIKKLQYWLGAHRCPDNLEYIFPLYTAEVKCK